MTLLPSRSARSFHAALSWAVAKLYFRAEPHGASPAASAEAALYVCLHRNGAVDGWIASCFLPWRTLPLVGANLRANPLTRPFAVGIPIRRSEDKREAGHADENAMALEACQAWLASGGSLLIFPEGRSDLGPKPLPFHRGAARLALEALGRGTKFAIVPMSVDYAEPATPGSQADLLFGKPVATDDIDPSSPDALALLHERLTLALTELAFVFADAPEQQRARTNALLEADGRRSLRVSLLRRLTADPPGRALADRRPVPSLGRRLRAWTASLPGLVLNAPLIAVVFMIARAKADGANVVALWRILAGLFLGPLWLALGACLGLWRFGAAGVLLPVAQLAFGLVALRFGADLRASRLPATPCSPSGQETSSA